MCDDSEPVDDDIGWLRSKKPDCTLEDVFQFTNMVEVFLDKGFSLVQARNLALNDLKILDFRKHE